VCSRTPRSIPVNEFSDFDIETVSEYQKNKLQYIPHRRDNATLFHRTGVGVPDFVPYPRLTNPLIEQEIHEGRKRIDLTFDYGASEGFSFRLPNQARLPCPFIFVECKNYGRELGTPEVDQLSGRFSFNRAKVGMLVCRSLEDPGLLIQLCRDTVKDDRGLMLPLVDADLIAGLRDRATGVEFPLEERLRELYAQIAM
jgi:hypothetical protein